jgi:hypothetical protein
MLETVNGPHLRDWCQQVGLLENGKDFADKKQRGSNITVRGARTFIMNYYKGKEIKWDKFDTSKTISIIAKTGTVDLDWETLRISKKDIWTDKKLIESGKEFSKLVNAQNIYFNTKTKRNSLDYADKAMNYAILSAWAYVAGVLSTNRQRLDRHYSLANITNKDPLNAESLAKARHKTDPDTYRGLGTRTNEKERGRLVELFFCQAERGDGITPSAITLALKKYYAKLAVLDVIEEESKT